MNGQSYGTVGNFKIKRWREKMRANFTEIDLIADELANIVATKGVVLPEEFEMLAKELSKKEKKILMKKLFAMNIEKKEDLLQAKRDGSFQTEFIANKDILSFLIRPEYVNSNPDYIQVGTQYFRGMVATGFPAKVNENWLGKLIQERSNIDFSIFIWPSSVRALEVYLSDELKKVENDLYSYTKRGLHNPSLEARKKELLEQLDNLIKGTYKLYKMSLYLISKGTSPEATMTLSNRILSSLRAEGIEAKQAINYQEQLMKSVIPTGRDYMQGRQIFVPGPAAAAAFPFSSDYYAADEEDGILLGFNDNEIPIGLSIWKLPKYVGVIIGATGAGKSYAAKALVLNDRMVNGTKIFILDPENEYTEMCKRIKNSQIISLDRKSKTIPNVLSLMGASLTDKLIALPKVLSVLFEGVTETQKPLLESALIETYKRKGITEANEKSWKKKAPKLSDLLRVLNARKRTATDPNIRSDYEVLASKLTRYTTGIFKFLNQSHNNLTLDSDFVVFEFKNLPDEIRPVMMMILLEFIKTKFLNDDAKKMLVLDEAWRVLKNKTEADYIENFARTFRKSNGALLLLTQSVAELKDSPEGKAYLANTAFQFILRTEGIVLDETAKLFHLNKTEQDIIRNAGLGQGILIWGDKRHKINVKVDPKTHELITTHPEEVKARKAKANKKMRKKIKKKVSKRKNRISK